MPQSLFFSKACFLVSKKDDSVIDLLDDDSVISNPEKSVVPPQPKCNFTDIIEQSKEPDLIVEVVKQSANFEKVRSNSHMVVKVD